MKLLLISHGNLAKEVFNVLNMITGSTENVSYMTLPYGVDLEAYKSEIIKHIEESDQILILADLFGGSPFMIASKIYGTGKYNDKMAIVTGMNLPMVLEVTSQMNDKTLDELKKLAVEIGKEGIVDLSEKFE